MSTDGGDSVEAPEQVPVHRSASCVAAGRCDDGHAESRRWTAIEQARYADVDVLDRTSRILRSIRMFDRGATIG